MVIIGLMFWVALGIMVLRRYLGKSTSVALLQYQGGILYNRGRRVREVAGKSRVWAGREKVIIVDKRPTSVSFENRAVALADGATAVFGFAGSAGVQDISKVLYCARNYAELPAYVLLLCTRFVLNQHSSGHLMANKEAVIEEVLAQALPRLDASGFALREFRFTHLSIASPPEIR